LFNPILNFVFHFTKFSDATRKLDSRSFTIVYDSCGVPVVHLGGHARISTLADLQTLLVTRHVRPTTYYRHLRNDRITTDIVSIGVAYAWIWPFRPNSTREHINCFSHAIIRPVRRVSPLKHNQGLLVAVATVLISRRWRDIPSGRQRQVQVKG